MSEKNILLEGLSSRSAPQVKKLEGTGFTSNPLAEYESLLGFRSELLRNETVLNFGSGGSDIGKELRDKEIRCNVVDLDLIYNPLRDPAPLKVLASIPAALNIAFSYSGDESRGRLAALRKKISGAEERIFVQGNGRSLPFPDHAFDHVFALWSTYQIPYDARVRAYEELMRVGDILHIGPTFRDDYDVLARLAKKQEFQVVACLPLRSEDLPIKFSSRADYDDFLRKTEESERIKVPLAQGPKITTILGEPVITSGKGGNTIVLRRNSE